MKTRRFIVSDATSYPDQKIAGYAFIVVKNNIGYIGHRIYVCKDNLCIFVNIYELYGILSGIFAYDQKFYRNSNVNNITVVCDSEEAFNIMRGFYKKCSPQYNKFHDITHDKLENMNLTKEYTLRHPHNVKSQRDLVRRLHLLTHLECRRAAQLVMQKDAESITTCMKNEIKVIKKTYGITIEKIDIRIP